MRDDDSAHDRGDGGHDSTRGLHPHARSPDAQVTGAGDPRGDRERANTLLMGDRLGYFATDDALERANTTCRGDTADCLRRADCGNTLTR